MSGGQERGRGGVCISWEMGQGRGIMGGVLSRACSWTMTLEEGKKANELHKLLLIIRSGGYLY